MEKKSKKGETIKRKIHVMLSVSVGAGIPKNKAFMYNVLNELYGKGAMSLKTYREYMEEYMGIPFGDDEQAELIPQTSNSNNTESLPMGSSRDVFSSGGVNPSALDRIEKERTGGNYNVK